MNKRATVEQGVRTAEVYRRAGIGVAAFFIVGYPGETVSSIEETFKLALSLPLDAISFNVPMPLPGSCLLSASAPPTRAKTGRARTSSRSSTHPRSTRPGCAAG